MLRYLTAVAPDGEELPLMSATREVVNVQGLAGLSAPRRVSRPRPGGHGTINRTRFRDAKLISVSGELWGGSEEGTLGELDRVNGLFAKCVDAPGLLKYGRGLTGPELQMGFRLASDVKEQLDGSMTLLNYAVQLEATTPTAFAQEEEALVSGLMGNTGGGLKVPFTFPVWFTRSNAGQLSYVNEGNVPAPVAFRIYGRAVNPRIRLLSTGDELVIDGTVSAGNFIELDANYSDPDRRVITLNANAERLDLLNFAESRWFHLPPGAGTLRLIAEDADPAAYMTANFRHAYG